VSDYEFLEWAHDAGGGYIKRQPYDGIKTVVCNKCKHIDIFMTDEKHNKLIDAEQKEAKSKKQLVNLQKERPKIQKEIEEQQKIIADENQTVKAVNEAKRRLEELHDKEQFINKIIATMASSKK